MLKRKLNKAAYEELSADVKALYSEKNGAYFLALAEDDDDAVGELRRAKDREAQENKENKRRIKELQEQLDELTGNDAKKRGDIETLEKSWREKLEKVTTDAASQVEKLTSIIQRSVLDSTAQAVASEISNAPALMARVLKDRLTVDLEGDTPVLRVLDAAGKPSAATLDDLKKEVVANKEYSAIIVASKATGSSTASGKQDSKRPGGAPLDANSQPKSFRDMTVAEKVGYLEQKKESSNNEG